MSENNTRGSYVIAKSVAAACRGIETHEQCYYETCRRVLFFFFRTESIRVDDVLGDVENNGKRTKPRERHAQYDVTNGVSVGSTFVTTTTRKHVCTGHARRLRHSLFGASIVFAGREKRERRRDGEKEKGRSKRRDGSEFAAGGIEGNRVRTRRRDGPTTSDGGDYCSLYVRRRAHVTASRHKRRVDECAYIRP